MSDYEKFMGSIRYADAETMRVAHSVAQRMEEEKAAWIASLRAQGVKAAHPDDGWVDREKNTVRLQYPQFNEGLKVDDYLALGWPSSKTRIVRIIGIEPVWYGGEILAFEEVKL